MGEIQRTGLCGKRSDELENGPLLRKEHQRPVLYWGIGPRKRLNCELVAEARRICLPYLVKDPPVKRGISLCLGGELKIYTCSKT